MIEKTITCLYTITTYYTVNTISSSCIICLSGIRGGVFLKRIKNIAFILTVIVAVLICASPILARTYIIQKGDTLFSIGKKYGTTIDELKIANNLQSDMIYPGQLLRIPQGKVYIPSSGNNNSLYVLGFYVDREMDQPSSYNSMTTNSELISAVAPFWYRLSPENGMEIWEHQSGDEPATADKAAVIEEARRNNVQALALVHNLLYGGQINAKKLASEMLATADTRRTFINQLESLIKKYGYGGVNLDIENVYLWDRDKFSLLVKELYERLDKQGYKVTVCVPAKTWDDRSNTWSGPFDYSEIGRYAHHVIIMSYDEHGYSSGPGPIASSGWVESVVKFAVQNIPPEKILLGIPGYGFDWETGQAGPTYLSYSQAMDIAVSRGAVIQWDESGKVPYFYYWNYGKEHQVWFENASSLTCKLDIVNSYTLGGIAVWRLGMEDPRIWSVLGTKIVAEK